MSLVGNFSTCSVCGKRKIIAKQLNKVLSQQNSIDVYLECKDCAAIPLWAKKQMLRSTSLELIKSILYMS